MIDSVLAVENAFRRAEECCQAGNYLQAETLCREILAFRPNHPNANHFLGFVRFELGHADAEELIRRAIRIDPRVYLYHANLGTVLEAKGQFEEARQCFARALTLAPDFAKGHAQLGLLLLRQGNLRDGFREFEWRWQEARIAAGHQRFPQPQWQGENLAGRTLFVPHEQGFGDTIQFVRYALLIKQREPDANVIIGCQPEVNALLKRSLPEVRVISPGEALPAFDFHCPVLSLPLAFGTATVEAIPSFDHYLTADAQKARRWRERLQDDAARLKIGLVWAGSKQHVLDQHRSIALPALARLSRVAGASFYSLQKGEAAIRTRTDAPFPIHDRSGELHDFEDTAALVSELDLVITVDTAVAHLAGALGKPVWVLLPFVGDWRWLTGRADSPWYPAMRLFRQKAPGQWAGVVEQAGEALENYSPAALS